MCDYPFINMLCYLYCNVSSAIMFVLLPWQTRQSLSREAQLVQW